MTDETMELKDQREGTSTRRDGSGPGRHGTGERASVLVAAFASPETERLGRRLGFPVAVVAATGDPTGHMRLLTESWHAAWTTCQGWFQPFDCGVPDPGDVAYERRPFDPRWMGGARLPDGLSLRDGCLAVDLPHGAPAADFATLFGLAMADRQFDRVARTPSRVRQRFGTGRLLEVAPRYALSPRGGLEPMTLVQDLYAFHPRHLPLVARAAAMAANGLAVRSLLALRVVTGERVDG